MSMGPDNEEPILEVSRFDRIQNTVKKATLGYFENPIRYLLFIFLPIIIIALLLGNNISWQIYAILAVLAGIETYRHFYGKRI